MKYLRLLLLVGIALFCGSVASHAQRGDDFHATVLDPTCNVADTQCILHSEDLGAPFSVSLDMTTCTDSGVTGLPAPPTPFGCFFGSNLTGSAISSITLDFDAISGVTGCDTDITGVSPSPAFSVSKCVVDPEGGFDLTFTGGTILPGHGFVILEEGVDAASFVGMATADPVPEPASMLLLTTGVGMFGLYMAKQRRAFAFIRK
jgi:PEP-CTERM motif